MRWCFLLFISLSLHAQVDVQHYQFSLTLSDTTNKIKGTAQISARFPKQATSFQLDLSGMTVTKVTENNKPVPFVQDSSKLSLSIQPGEFHTFTIKYEGVPKDGL